MENPSLIVTTTSDVVDENDNETSLREAINAVNNGTFASGSTIRFAGDASLTGDDALLTLTDPSGSGTIFLAEALDDLRIEQSLNIIGDLDGDGTGDITIDADSGAGLDDADSRLFILAGEAEHDFDTEIVTGVPISVTLEGLTLRDGDSPFSGGAIFVQEADQLRLVNSVLEDNTANNSAGAILVDDAASVEIIGSTISNNTGDSAGAIFADYFASVTISDSTINGNQSLETAGGAIFAARGSTLDIAGSDISNNTTEAGGGAIYHNGSISNSTGRIVISDTTIGYNTAQNDGGGIDVGPDTATYVFNSEIIGNQAIGASSLGGGLNHNGSGSLTSDVPIVVAGSLFYNNEATTSGGAIRVEEPTAELLVANTTITGNTAGGEGGGIYVDTTSAATLVNTTITDNVAANGGGVAVIDPTGVLNVSNSIVADNTGTTSGDDLFASGADATLSGSGLNVLGSGPTGFGEDLGAAQLVLGDGNALTLSDILEADLADNGGSTDTIALVSSLTNPGLDTGDGAVAFGISLDEAALGVDINGDGDMTDVIDSIDDLGFDQRGAGFDRSVDQAEVAGSDQIDVGAFELNDQIAAPNAPVNVVLDFEESTSAPNTVEYFVDGVSEGVESLRFRQDTVDIVDLGIVIQATEDGVMGAAEVGTIAGGVSVVSVPGDNGLFVDRRSIESNERLVLSVAETPTLGGITEFGGTVLNVNGTGEVALEFFNDGVEIDSATVALVDGAFFYELPAGLDADEVRIGSTDSLTFAIDDLEFQRIGGDDTGGDPGEPNEGVVYRWDFVDAGGNRIQTFVDDVLIGDEGVSFFAGQVNLDEGALMIDASSDLEDQSLVRVSSLGDGISVRTDPDDNSPRAERRTIESDEVLQFAFEDVADAGDALDISLDFVNVSGVGSVEISFFNDDVLADVATLGVVGGSASFDLAGDATFDRIEISATDDLNFAIESLEITREELVLA